MDKNSIRENAVELHENAASSFVDQYLRADNPYYTSFLYGRKRIEVLFNKEIERLQQGAEILDVGCGTGEQIKCLLERGFNVIGIEPARNMREYAQRNLPEGTVQEGSILDLPFPENHFDFVYALEVFRYLDHGDNIRGFEEMFRVLKPGGLFFASFVNKYSLDGFYILTCCRKVNKKVFGKQMKAHTEFETPKTVVSLAKEVGYANAETHGAMLAIIRIVYKISRAAGEFFARKLESLDQSLSNKARFKKFSGHLLLVARK